MEWWMSELEEISQVLSKENLAETGSGQYNIKDVRKLWLERLRQRGDLGTIIDEGDAKKLVTKWDRRKLSSR